MPAGHVPFALLCLLITAGCSTHNTTLAPRDSGSGQVIYRISEEQAFITVLDAYAQVLPKQSLFDLSGARRGYQATFRFGLDTYTQKVLIVPTVGTDSTGREVQGHWFDVSGGGTAGISGGGKNRELFRRIVEALDATGTATVVTNVRDGRYETDGRQYRAGGKDAREAASGARSPGSSGVADRLRELKTLRDQGLITDEEYEAKRKLGGWASLSMVERYAHTRQELAAATQAMVDAREARRQHPPQITPRPVIAKARHA